VARCLIIGCGCRGRALAAALIAGGHAVRGTSRTPAGATLIEAAGAEPVLADPDRVATLGPALEHVGVACVLLGSAEGSPNAVRALHGPRLQMLLSRMLDSTIRGIVYEAGGSLDAAVLAGGAELVRSFCERSRIPYALLSSEAAGGHRAWLGAALGCVEQVLER